MSARGSGASRAIGLTVSAAAVVVLLAGCSVSETFHGFGWPNGVTTQAHQMHDLWIGSTVAALAVGVFVWGLIFWCVVKYRKRGDELPPQTRYNMPIEILFTVTPILVVCVLFYYTAIAQTNVNKLSAHPDVNVEVVAFKWNWQFKYSDTKGPDGKPVSTTGADNYIPVLVVPTHKKIQFTETSRDVIHSFWVPEILFKRDVIPGVKNKFEITVEQEGAWVGRCAELCGTYHSMMNFEMRAVTPEKYDAYLKARLAGMSTPAALVSIGEDRGKNGGLAVTTDPFDTVRGENAVNGRTSG